MQDAFQDYFLKEIITSDTFCPRYWHTIATKLTGHYALCCMAKEFSSQIKDSTPLEHYVGEHMRAVRLASLSQDKKYLSTFCQKCFYMESQGLESLRLHKIKFLIQHPEIMNRVIDMVYQSVAYPETSAIPNYIREIDLKIFGNSCNLKCYTCDEMSSSAIFAEKQKIGELAADRKMPLSA